MTAYEQIWPVAEDHYGIITAAKARELGISKQSMSAMVQSGRLTRLGHGVYQVQHHVPGQNDVYAFANAVVGEDAYLRVHPYCICCTIRQQTRRRSMSALLSE